MDFIHNILFEKINGGTDYQKKLLIGYYKEFYKISFLHDSLNAFLSQVITGNVTIELAITSNKIVTRGCCLTNEKVVYNNILRKFVKHFHFTLALRKIDPATLLHEMAHALERISGENIGGRFWREINLDLQNQSRANYNLQNAIDKILYDDLSYYPKTQHASEFFARFYQMFAMSKEVGSYDSNFHFKVADVTNFFLNTTDYLKNDFNNILQKSILDKVKKQTQKIDFSEDIKSFKSKFHADQKVGKDWSKKIKSNFD